MFQVQSCAQLHSNAVMQTLRNNAFYPNLSSPLKEHTRISTTASSHVQHSPRTNIFASISIIKKWALTQMFPIATLDEPPISFSNGNHQHPPLAGTPFQPTPNGPCCCRHQYAAPSSQSISSNVNNMILQHITNEYIKCDVNPGTGDIPITTSPPIQNLPVHEPSSGSTDLAIRGGQLAIPCTHQRDVKLPYVWQ